MNEALNKPSQYRWRMILTFGAFAALLILVYGLRDQIIFALSRLDEVNTTALLLMVPIQALNYDAYARLYCRLFGVLGARMRYADMYRLGVELTFVNNILPSGGISGISYFGLRARSFGVSALKATVVQVAKMLLLYISFQPLLVLGVIFLAIQGHVNDIIIMVATAIITLLVITTALLVYVIGSRSRINAFLTLLTKIANRIIQLVRPKNPETINVVGAQKAFTELHEHYQLFKNNLGALKKPYLYMTIANATEIATLYVVYIAFGEFVNIGAVILAYAVANFAGLISVLPAGIGIYEGLMTIVLAATGIPPSLSIPVTVTYRVLNMALQLTPGYFLYQRAVKNGLVNSHSQRPNLPTS